MQLDHFRPSGAPRWVHCVASPTMESCYIDSGSDQADEGTLAHEVAAIKLNGLPVPTLESEMVYHVDTYVLDVQDTVNNIDKTVLHVEEPVTMDRVYPGLKGTPDAWCLDIKNMILYVWDLKYGYGIVEAYENWQLICYALGIIDTIRDLEMNLTVCMRIVQPRARHEEGPVREWRIPATELRNYGNKLSVAAQQVHGPDPECKSGPHCRRCLALSDCQCANLAGLNAVDVVSNMQISVTGPVEQSKMLLLLERATDMIKHLKLAHETQALAAIKNGVSIPGWTVTDGIGNKQWVKTDQEVYEIGDMMGIDLRKPTVPITPTQAIKAGMPVDMLQPFFNNKKATVKLKKDNKLAERIFI